MNYKFNVALVAPGASLDVSMLEELRVTVPKILVLAERKDEITHLSRSLFGDAFLLQSSSNEELVDRLAKMMAFGDTAQNGIASVPTTLCIEDRRLDLAAHVYIDADGYELPLTRAEAVLLGNWHAVLARFGHVTSYVTPSLDEAQIPLIAASPCSSPGSGTRSSQTQRLRDSS